MAVKFVLIVQCDKSRERCSGFACTNSFYNREGFFKGRGYEEGVRYLALTCGGCCGTGLAMKLEHFSKKLLKKTDIKKEEVAVHLSSCMVTDNYHHDRCPNIAYIKDIVRKKGYGDVVDGTYLSEASERKRCAGVYKRYDR